jgi:hypothetical protein
MPSRLPCSGCRTHRRQGRSPVGGTAWRVSVAMISLFVLSGTTLGPDLRTADPNAVNTALGGRHAPAHPTEPPAINAKTNSAFVDGLWRTAASAERRRPLRSELAL